MDANVEAANQGGLVEKPGDGKNKSANRDDGAQHNCAN